MTHFTVVDGLQGLKGEKEINRISLNVGGVRIYGMGVAIKPDQLSYEVTASAAGLDEKQIELRCLGELNERLALAHFKSKNAVLPQSPYTLSISNGVAYHPDRETARRSAMYELIERDHLMRWWKGDLLAQEITTSREAQENTTFQKVRPLNVRLFLIANRVVVAYAPPLEKARPFLLGYGCSESLSRSIEKACNEGLQRLAFLWDEPPSVKPLEGLSGIELHEEFYLKEGGHLLVEEWLTASPEKLSQPELPLPNDFQFQDLPAHHLETGGVIRCTSKSCLPLYWGWQAPWDQPNQPSTRPLHPVT